MGWCKETRCIGAPSHLYLLLSGYTFWKLAKSKVGWDRSLDAHCTNWFVGWLRLRVTEEKGLCYTERLRTSLSNKQVPDRQCLGWRDILIWFISGHPWSWKYGVPCPYSSRAVVKLECTHYAEVALVQLISFSYSKFALLPYLAMRDSWYVKATFTASCTQTATKRKRGGRALAHNPNGHVVLWKK